MNNFEAQVMYAYHLGIKETKLSFGIKVGVYSQTIDWDKVPRYIQSMIRLLMKEKNRR